MKKLVLIATLFLLANCGGGGDGGVIELVETPPVVEEVEECFDVQTILTTTNAWICENEEETGVAFQIYANGTGILTYDADLFFGFTWNDGVCDTFSIEAFEIMSTISQIGGSIENKVLFFTETVDNGDVYNWHCLLIDIEE